MILTNGSQIIRECFENLKTPNKSENLDKMDKFLSAYDLQKLKLEYITLNISIANQEGKKVLIKSVSAK